MGGRNARTPGAAETADRQSVADHRHGKSRRHARLLRLLPDRLRAGLHHRLLATDLRPVGDDPAGIRSRRRARGILLGLDGRQDRPPQGVHGHRAERGDRHRHHGDDAGPGRLHSRLAVPGVLPLLRRLRQCRPDRGGHPAGTGIRPGVQARLGERADHRAAAGGQSAGCGVGRVSRTGDRLARPVPGRPRTGGAGADDPLLGARITALAAAHGPDGGGPQVARLGAAGRSAADHAADQHSRRGEGGAVGAVVPLSAQRGGILSHRDQPDRRRRAAAVDHRAVRAGAADHAGRGLVPDDLCQPRRHRRTPGRARTCPMRSAAARRAC